MKPFLILQLRPEIVPSDNEYEAILAKSGLRASDTIRVRLEQAPLPPGLDLDAFSGVIVGGGPGCVSDPEDKKTPVEKQVEEAVLGLMPAIVARDVPFLGCCYGIGILAHHLGAGVSKDRYGEEVGTAACTVTEAGRDDPLLAGMAPAFDAFVGHKEAVQELPPGCVHLLASPTCPFQMIRYGRNVYATQFHPEADPDVFEIRIRTYKDYGYFPPEDADRLIAMCRAAHVDQPEKILRNFVATYG